MKLQGCSRPTDGEVLIFQVLVKGAGSLRDYARAMNSDWGLGLGLWPRGGSKVSDVDLWAVAFGSIQDFGPHASDTFADALAKSRSGCSVKVPVEDNQVWGKGYREATPCLSSKSTVRGAFVCIWCSRRPHQSPN